MQEARPVQADRRQKRGFILGSLSLGHGFSHLYDQSLQVFLPAITSSLGLSTFQVASLHSIRQAGFGLVNLGAGPFVDRLRSQWGLILTACTVGTGISFVLIGASPNFAILLIPIVLVSIPGALWHLPAAAALSQLFPDRRGFAISVHGFGSSIGNVLGPLVAGGLLAALLWRHALFIYVAPALVLSVFVWWSLKDLGREGETVERQGGGIQFRDAWVLIKNPVVLGLVIASTLRGVGLNAIFNWTTFYLKEDLGIGHFRTGVYFALITGAGIVSTPALGALSDKFGRKAVLLPGMVLAAVLTMAVARTGDSLLLPLVLAGVGLFSFALHNIIQAAVLDMVDRGTEATATGLMFGITGVIGSMSPYLSAVIIEHLGGLGSIYYFAGILTAVTAVIIAFLPLRRS